MIIRQGCFRILAKDCGCLLDVPDVLRGSFKDNAGAGAECLQDLRRLGFGVIPKSIPGGAMGVFAAGDFRVDLADDLICGLFGLGEFLRFDFFDHGFDFVRC